MTWLADQYKELAEVEQRIGATDERIRIYDYLMDLMRTRASSSDARTLLNHAALTILAGEHPPLRKVLRSQAEVVMDATLEALKR